MQLFSILMVFFFFFLRGVGGVRFIRQNAPVFLDHYMVR